MNSQKSLYLQLSEQLIQDIRKMGNHQKFLSEREICHRYAMSRTTVRSALNHLEDLGYISRQHGKGTFTSHNWKDRPKLSMGYSFSEQMQAIGKKPSSQLLGVGQVIANQDVSNALEIERDTPVWYLHRLRLADEQAMMLEMTYLPTNLFPGLSNHNLKDNSLYHLLETIYHQDILFADEVFMADQLTDEQANYLNVATGDPCLNLTRKAYNQDRTVIEYTRSVARHDCFYYQVRHFHHR